VLVFSVSTLRISARLSSIQLRARFTPRSKRLQILDPRLAPQSHSTTVLTHIHLGFVVFFRS